MQPCGPISWSILFVKAVVMAEDDEGCSTFVILKLRRASMMFPHDNLAA